MGWKEESFIGNFNAAADTLGYDNIDIAWALAGVQYDSSDDRDKVLYDLASEAFPIIQHETFTEDSGES